MFDNDGRTPYRRVASLVERMLKPHKNLPTAKARPA